MNKEQMQKKLEQVLNNVGFAKKSKRKDFIEKGKDIEIRLANCDINSEVELVEIKYAIFELETELEIGSYRMKLAMFIIYALLFLLYAVIYAYINNVDLNRYLSYVASSVVGALIYFVSTRSIEGTDAPIYKFLIAIALPFAFISFLYTAEDGQIFDVNDKMLWAFVLGYSCDLFILLMNKIIAKIKVAIG
jgi:hypothetical protein